jgi:hypothetical protein
MKLVIIGLSAAGLSALETVLRFAPDAEIKIVPVQEIPPLWAGLDIGPATMRLFAGMHAGLRFGRRLRLSWYRFHSSRDLIAAFRIFSSSKTIRGSGVRFVITSALTVFRFHS